MQKRSSSKKKQEQDVKTGSLGKKILPAIPTIILGIVAVMLNYFPKSEDVVIRFKTDRVVFISDLGNNQKFNLLKAIPVESIGLINSSPIKISFQKLYALTSNSSPELIKEKSTVEFTPEFQRYSEFKLYEGNLKVGSLEIDKQSIVDIALRDRLIAKKVKMEIRGYPTNLHIQLMGDSAKIMTDKFAAFDNQGARIIYPEDVCQKYYLFLPWEVNPISKINGIDNEIIINIDFSDSILSATKIYETGKHGIPIKKLGFSDAAVNPFVQETVITALCTEFKVADKIKVKFIGQTVFCKATDFKKLRINDISLKPGLGQKINVMLKGNTSKLHVGITEESMQNVLPSILEYLATKWAIVIAVLGWLITTSFLVYGKLWSDRRKR